ncbi:hypothetical protein AG1IA_09683 [Rhizoctonia solani AG-1 IA]|uniref:Uncharacterized protein n=1 Tax=Thanatephorus cucumeris (strain AG1-IA) TaxID=983506 RepID=L8WHP1_THACA|nr:hypothetical protein AG1IA_09683 [Rhizoctonia solani AG-1 IA]
MVGMNMATRLSAPVVNTSGRLTRNRMFSASSRACTSSKIGHNISSLDPKASVDSKPASSIEKFGSLQDPTIPETPESKSRYQQNRPTPPRRPGVKPPPTLALPSSMFPPPPRVPVPTSLQRGSGSEASDSQEKTFNLYMNSLNKHYDDEPTLNDLDALRPPPSTILAALNGVIGSGRALLDPNHPLHLTIERLGAQEASVGGGPKSKRTVVAGSKKAKRLEYQALYAATEAMITRGFTVAQLRIFEKETKMERGFKKVDLPPGKSSSKPRVIHSLMNLRWGMIHPAVVGEYMDRESKPIEQSYRVSPSELFIFLGRDGEDLIQLSKQLNMRIDVDRQPDPPVSTNDLSHLNDSATRPGFMIRATGTKSSHEKLRKHIEGQRDIMTVRVITLPTGPSLSPSLLQNISRIAGAFVENIDSKFASLGDADNSAASVSITAHSPRSAYTAERLVQRAALEAEYRSKLPLFVLENGEPSATSLETEYGLSSQADLYALYPFSNHGFRVRLVQQAESATQRSSSNTSALPFTSKAFDVQKYGKDEAFILTGQERSESEPQVDSTATGQSTKGIIFRNLHGEVIDIDKLVFGEGGEGDRVITTIFGHIVFKTGKATMLDSPLTGPVASESILKWINELDSRAPSTHVPADVTSVHRLQYRTIEGEHIINVNVQLPDHEAEPSAEQAESAESSETNTPAQTLELPTEAQPTEGNTDSNHPIPSHIKGDSIPDQDRSEDSISSDSLTKRTTGVMEEDSSKGNPDTSEATSLPVEITVGTESAFELMLPESTMDLYVQVVNTTRIAKPMIPETLDVYLERLSKFFTTDIEIPQPDPPQYLDFDGKHYVLVKNTSARSGRSTSVDLPDKFTVNVESSLDLESNLRTTFTELSHRWEASKESWESVTRAWRTLASKRYARSTELRASPT